MYFKEYKLNNDKYFFATYSYHVSLWLVVMIFPLILSNLFFKFECIIFVLTKSLREDSGILRYAMCDTQIMSFNLRMNHKLF
jgi:hypothetical protein